MESLIFLSDKRDGTTKGRMCANGSTQRRCIPMEEASSPALITQSVLITIVMDAKKEIDVVSMDIPNAFVQTKVPQGDEIIIMKI